MSADEEPTEAPAEGEHMAESGQTAAGPPPKRWSVGLLWSVLAAIAVVLVVAVVMVVRMLHG